jgi:ParB/RepB/Spo0J family partition protein
MKKLVSVPLSEIDLHDRLTDFSLNPNGCPEKLLDSVKEIGIRHPISICSTNKPYKIISGHKRVQATIKAGLNSIPAFFVPTMDDALVTNLKENFALRHYSDIEKGCILNKLISEGFEEDTIIDLYMPLLELERSKKIFQDLILVEKIRSELQKLLHRSNVPVKVFQVFFAWNNKNQEAAEKFFAATRPGVNKWRDLLELIEEISRRDKISPEDIFFASTTIETLKDKNLTPSQKYDRAYQALQQKRYPVLSELKKQVLRALDEMKLDDKTRFKYDNAFESDEMKLELKFRDERELSQQVEKIFNALQSGAVNKVVKIIREQE